MNLFSRHKERVGRSWSKQWASGEAEAVDGANGEMCKHTMWNQMRWDEKRKRIGENGLFIPGFTKLPKVI